MEGDASMTEDYSPITDEYSDRENGEYFDGPHGRLKKKDGLVLPVPERYCSCGKVGQATGTLPRYTCADPECIVRAFA